jgi:hypothetical protein
MRASLQRFFSEVRHVRLLHCRIGYDLLMPGKKTGSSGPVRERKGLKRSSFLPVLSGMGFSLPDITIGLKNVSNHFFIAREKQACSQ